jgi:hypothetical protein
MSRGMKWQIEAAVVDRYPGSVRGGKRVADVSWGGSDLMEAKRG